MEEKKRAGIVGIWKVLRPDTRQYKQQSIEVELNCEIFIPIPVEYIHFQEGDTGKIVLTVAGMKYVQDQFELLYLDNPTEAWEEVNKKANDEGWGDEEQSKVEDKAAEDDGWTDFQPEKVEKSVEEVVDEGWGEDPVFDDDEKSGDTNKPDTETWNEEEEGW